METPPKGSEVVLPAGEKGEGGMGTVRCRKEEGEKGVRGRGRSGQGSREGEEKGEKKVQATKSGGSKVGSDDDEAFSTRWGD